MTKKEWDSFIDDVEDCVDFEVSDLKTDSKKKPKSSMPTKKQEDAPKYYK